MWNRETLFPAGTEFSKDDEREFAREELIFNVTKDLLVLMENLGVSKSELADRLGKSKSHVTQLLNGNRNMTLGTFSDICFSVGAQVNIDIKKASDDLMNECDWFVESFANYEIEEYEMPILPITSRLQKRKPHTDWFNCEIIPLKVA